MNLRALRFWDQLHSEVFCGGPQAHHLAGRVPPPASSVVLSSARWLKFQLQRLAQGGPFMLIT